VAAGYADGNRTFGEKKKVHGAGLEQTNNHRTK
jgi:hypothetical protein